MNVAISFLTIDDMYVAELPSEFDAAPQATAGWTYDGSRFVTYMPKGRFDTVREFAEFNPAFDVERDGVRVSVYERAYDPPLLSALWWLEDGYLGTFIEDPLPTTAETMTTVIEAITVQSIVDGPVPRLTFESPLTRTTGDVELNNALSFVPATSLNWWPYVEFSEAPDATPGDSGISPDGSNVSAWSVAAPGLIVSCLVPEDNTADGVNLSAQIAQSVQVNATG